MELQPCQAQQSSQMLHTWKAEEVGQPVQCHRTPHLWDDDLGQTDVPATPADKGGTHHVSGRGGVGALP